MHYACLSKHWYLYRNLNKIWQAAARGGSTIIVVSFYVFLLHALRVINSGNSFVLYVCYKAAKRRGPSNAYKWFIANLTIADLTFTLLSIMNSVINFLWTWFGGQA